MVADDDFEARRARRTSWPVRVFRLGAEPGDDLSDSTTAEERLEMMWPLALEAYTFAGNPLPNYTRAETPVRSYRRAPAEATGHPNDLADPKTLERGGK